MSDLKTSNKPKRRSELAGMLDALEKHLPALVAENNETDGEFWCAFAGEADVIEDLAVDPEDVAYVKKRISAMLAANGKNPDTDVPCDG